MYTFSYILICVRKTLLSWNSSGMDALDNILKATELHIQALEDDSLDGVDFTNLETMRNKYKPLLRQNSIKWA